MNRLADNAAASNNGWCVYLFHGIDNDGGYSPVSTATLQGCVDYMDKNRQKFWIESFGNVIRYIRERNAVSIEEIAATTGTSERAKAHALQKPIDDPCWPQAVLVL